MKSVSSETRPCRASAAIIAAPFSDSSRLMLSIFTSAELELPLLGGTP